MKWKDKIDVVMLSTKHTGAMAETSRKKKNCENVQKPQAVIYYNQSKQGIDVSDQMSSYHTCVRKSIR